MIACLLAIIAPGAASACRLALALALDVSSSVDDTEYLLQRDGVAAALTSPDVVTAITQDGPIALAIYEWSGRRQSIVVQDWVILRGQQDIAAVTQRLEGVQRSYRRYPTAMGYALGFGAQLLQRAPQCDRQVIDLSGDGVTNDGFGPFYAYKHFPFDGVTVNGLAVLGADPAVIEHFDFEVLHGPGAFLEIADGYPGYARAMERKLYREIRARVVGSLPAEDAVGAVTAGGAMAAEWVTGARVPQTTGEMTGTGGGRDVMTLEQAAPRLAEVPG